MMNCRVIRLLFVACVLKVYLSHGACPGGITTFDYKNQDKFNINLNPKGDDVRNSLRGSQHELVITNKKQKVIISSKQNSFTVELFELQFAAISRVLVQFKLNGKPVAKSQKKLSKKADWTTFSTKQMPNRVDEIIISFKLSKKAKGAKIRNVFLQSCFSIASGQGTSGTSIKIGTGSKTAHGVLPDDFLQTFGLGKSLYAKAIALSSKVQLLAAKQMGINNFQPRSMAIYDILMTPKQLESLYKNMQKLSKNKGKRGRRSTFLTDFNKWPNSTVKYVMDESLKYSERNVVLGAIYQIQHDTCIRFVNTSDTTQERHIIFIKDPTQIDPNNKKKEIIPCKSFLGQTMTRQPIILTDDCLRTERIGRVLHMIVHALGMGHEIWRPDFSQHFESIDRYKFKNTFDVAGSIFGQPTVRTYDTPYDFNSITQFSGGAFRAGPTDFTFKTKDQLMQQNIGQENRLSFNDRWTLNNMYCKSKCSQSIECARNGYQNPNYCSTCICPTGFSGSQCNETDFGSPDCNPDKTEITVTSEEEQCLTSPHYDTKGYSHGGTCNWLLKAPPLRRIIFNFKDDFIVRCNSERVNDMDYPSQCIHWVEIKYKSDLTETGPRFCCSFRPPQITSVSNEALVNFNYRVRLVPTSVIRTKGFKLCYALKPYPSGSIGYPAIVTSNTDHGKIWTFIHLDTFTSRAAVTSIEVAIFNRDRPLYISIFRKKSTGTYEVMSQLKLNDYASLQVGYNQVNIPNDVLIAEKGDNFGFTWTNVALLRWSLASGENNYCSVRDWKLPGQVLSCGSEFANRKFSIRINYIDRSGSIGYPAVVTSYTDTGKIWTFIDLNAFPTRAAVTSVEVAIFNKDRPLYISIFRKKSTETYDVISQLKLNDYANLLVGYNQVNIPSDVLIAEKGDNFGFTWTNVALLRWLPASGENNYCSVRDWKLPGQVLSCRSEFANRKFSVRINYIVKQK